MEYFFPILNEGIRIRISTFALDGEAVLLGVDDRSDFDGLHSRLHNDEVQLYAKCCFDDRRISIGPE
jgi:bifunctional non-homologous end joining protein LigD